MAKNTIAYYTKDGRGKNTPLIGTSITDIFLAGTDGTKILSIYVTDFSGSGIVNIYLNDGNNHLIASISDTDLANNSNVFNYTFLPTTSNGDKYINIPAGSKLTANRTLSSASFFVYGEDY